LGAGYRHGDVPQVFLVVSSGKKVGKSSSSDVSLTTIDLDRDRASELLDFLKISCLGVLSRITSSSQLDFEHTTCDLVGFGVTSKIGSSSLDSRQTTLDFVVQKLNLGSFGVTSKIGSSSLLESTETTWGLDVQKLNLRGFGVRQTISSSLAPRQSTRDLVLEKFTLRGPRSSLLLGPFTKGVKSMTSSSQWVTITSSSSGL
jgi:hypothetical protein